jgi:NAD(P)-dependent dehydrogenase (short-subunit alcohol dehydrogenase family)
MKVIVTGHASGIGAYVSEKLHSIGYSLTCIDINHNPNLDKEILQINCNLINDVNVSEAFNTIDDFDFAINCAGVPGRRDKIENFTSANYMENFESVFLPLFNSLREEILISKKSRKLRKIINISSITAKFGCQNMSAYSAAKAAISNLTKVAAIENKPHLIVNSISPATIDTPMIRNKYNGSIPDYSNSYPVSRCGTVEDVYQAIQMMMRSEFMTGYDLELDGGYSSLFEMRL